MKTIVYNNATNQQNEATHNTNTHKHPNTKFKRIFMEKMLQQQTRPKMKRKMAIAKEVIAYILHTYFEHTYAHIDSSKSKMHYITSKLQQAKHTKVQYISFS